MERLFKLFEGLLPLLAFYPRWYQTLFLIVLCLVAVLAIVGIALYSNASHNYARHKIISQIGISVSVMQDEQNQWSRSSDTKLEYSANRTEDKTLIFPSMGYLSTLCSGGPIQPIPDYFGWDFPTLDVKVVNNSDKTLFLNEAVLTVERSQLDPTPVLIIRPDSYRSNALHFLIENEGWGIAKDVSASFHLTPINDKVSPTYLPPFPYSVSIGDIAEAVNVDLTASFAKAGVDLPGLSSLGMASRSYGNMIVIDTLDQERILPKNEFEEERAPFLGPFEYGSAMVSGELSYKPEKPSNYQGRVVVKFETIVWLYDEYLVLAPAPPSFEYGVRLDVDGRDYVRRVNISQEIKPGESDRFGIKVGVDKSSIHTLSLQLLSNGSEDIYTEEIALSIFVPRSGSRFQQTPEDSGNGNS